MYVSTLASCLFADGGLGKAIATEQANQTLASSPESTINPDDSAEIKADLDTFKAAKLAQIKR